MPRSERLRSLGAVRRLFTEGQGGFVYPFRYMYYVTRPEVPETASPSEEGLPGEGRGAEPCLAGDIEVLFSVPKKFHKRANRRNLLKRRTREAYRLNRDALRDALRDRGVEVDVALVYSVKECQSYKNIEHAVQRILERIRTHL